MSTSTRPNPGGQAPHTPQRWESPISSTWHVTTSGDFSHQLVAGASSHSRFGTTTSTQRLATWTCLKFVTMLPQSRGGCRLWGSVGGVVCGGAWGVSSVGERGRCRLWGVWAVSSVGGVGGVVCGGYGGLAPHEHFHAPEPWGASPPHPPAMGKPDLQHLACNNVWRLQSPTRGWGFQPQSVRHHHQNATSGDLDMSQDRDNASAKSWGVVCIVGCRLWGSVGGVACGGAWGGMGGLPPTPPGDGKTHLSMPATHDASIDCSWPAGDAPNWSPAASIPSFATTLRVINDKRRYRSM